MHAILSHLQTSPTAFHVPGHKMGRGLPGELGAWLSAAGRLDLTEIPGLDDLHAPEGAIRDAQRLAAEAFGAEETFFLINGSTAGNLAMVMTVCQPGDIILVPRNLHKSVIHGLVLAQARPVFYQPEVVAEFGIAGRVPAAEIARAVRENPQAKAVLITSPTYHGIASDLALIAGIVHEAGMLLLVDEAHGAHFAFHEQLPPTAMASGADMAVQSTHKLLGALTQASMLHVQGPRVDRVRLRKRLQLVQSTSPSYLLMASLDAARYQMETEGQARLEKALRAAADGRQQLLELPGLQVLPADDLLKWTIRVTGLGITGTDAYRILHEEHKMMLELSDPYNVLAVLSYADGERQVDRLVTALAKLAPSGHQLTVSAYTAPPKLRAVLPLHDAFDLPSVTVPLREAAGKVAAEMVIPYPPGIPLVLPGEEMTRDMLEYIEQLRSAGIRFSGAEDAALNTVQVIRQ
ncbi:arginine/lysine/ornithine decarboxylase [Tumebacillus sp. BK434]|uniref:aminotransferase class I/II-fold pyridoxal phosphate-dependent enzyme n=1 Tax=Tumebacillus sp. BK434 TaxID=2512169 RepID=UPI0010E8D9CC|nr:aminotransferase class I/II-fold pyridoxal phosphate-dependent enzyme [Tumebacillus sp. BK434]TCP52659.1 arginine/lysine/ornithine decarboxylase [Tumebacillus sp. BK434]